MLYTISVCVRSLHIQILKKKNMHDDDDDGSQEQRVELLY